jgi:circadian clock protein KaiC
MTARKRRQRLTPQVLEKSPTGIPGLDDITGGGLPKGRPTLVCGGAGCGKTLLALEFLVRGALQHQEPGVFMAFEEQPAELAANVASLGFDLQALAAHKQLLVDYVYVERSEIEETGVYDLEGLFVRLGHAIESIGAKRVVLDTIEALFAGFIHESVVRAELRRLFRWLKSQGVTAVITGERGEGTLTRHGLEEYVSDCVLLLSHEVTQQVSTRRLRVVKYRGSAHGTNEYPFLVGAHGLSVLPITALGLQHQASTERLSSGIARLDAMLGGQGFFRGSSVLVSGTAGAGKTSVAAHFTDAACRRDERVLYWAFEESPRQIIRNMRSIGLDLESWVDRGLLRFAAVRPTQTGLESHLATMCQAVEESQPHVVVADPVTNLFSVGTDAAVQEMLTRLIDFLKTRAITALFTSLTSGSGTFAQSGVNISSLIDTWIMLEAMAVNGERNHTLAILKSRGMAHSNQVREFRLTDHGVELVEVSTGPEGILTGSARLAREAQLREAEEARRQELALQQRRLARKRRLVDAQIAALRAEVDAEAEEVQRLLRQHTLREARLADDRAQMARQRHAEAAPAPARRPRRGRGGRP